ncbi:hypothetical protein [Sphingomonas sp. Mn802worker]|uniref:hypothetical protein n=1 Tax=Sphingomonas sp. Mn802worker TaxID=629773 RepID=UPI0003660812|nr:hypothetical protein [Sphingomonas sp. Mn802worker]
MQKFVMAAAAAGVALCGALGWWVSQSPEPRTPGLIVVQRSPEEPVMADPRPLAAVAPVTQKRVDPIENEPDQLFMKVRSEAKDEHWSAQAEARLDAALRHIPGIGHGRPLTITCGASTCEVSGSAANNDDYDKVQNTWVALNAAMRDPELARAGLALAGSTLGTARDVAGFVIYYRRQPA